MTRTFYNSTLVAFLSASVLSCCVTPERALRNLGCNESVSRLVNNVLMNTWGIGSFVCVRLRTGSQAEQRSVEAACKIAQAPRALTVYPARGNPMLPPPWWDLRERA